MAPLLALNDISYSYHSLTGVICTLSHISFQIEAGEFVSIVGPSGCGKSTLLSIIAGLLTPETGSIQCKQKQIGYMLQQDHLLPWYTVYQNICLGLKINKQLTTESLSYIKALIDDYGLSSFSDKKPSQLSGGMRQRAALIRTLALKPELLLLDEPFSALDYQTRIQVSGDICSKIKKAGKTALLITHDLSEAITLSDRILVLSARPGTILDDIDVHLTLKNHDLLAARNAPEYPIYFEKIWKELTYGSPENCTN